MCLAFLAFSACDAAPTHTSTPTPGSYAIETPSNPAPMAFLTATETVTPPPAIAIISREDASMSALSFFAAETSPRLTALWTVLGSTVEAQDEDCWRLSGSVVRDQDPWYYAAEIESNAHPASSFLADMSLRVILSGDDGALKCVDNIDDGSQFTAEDPVPDHVRELEPPSLALRKTKMVAAAEPAVCRVEDALPDGIESILPDEHPTDLLDDSQHSMSPDLVSSLRSFPLLPGNRWVYRSDHFMRTQLWRTGVITDTVTEAILVRPDFLAVAIVRQRSPGPGASGWMPSDNITATEHCALMAIWKDEVYRSDGLFKSHLMSVNGATMTDILAQLHLDPVPTVAPSSEYHEQRKSIRRQLPSIRFGTLASGPPLPGASFGTTDREIESIDPWRDGHDGPCYRWGEGHGMLTSEYVEFCEGIGFTQLEMFGATTMNPMFETSELETFSIARTVDDFLR